jgi:hypothetical protein
VPDRVDTRGAARLQRSPSSTHKQFLQVSALPNSSYFAVRALHTPLVQLLSKVEEVTKMPLLAASDVATRDISLSLPTTNIGEFLRALATGYGLSVVPRRTGGWILTRAVPETSAAVAQANTGLPVAGAVSLHSVPLQNLSVERARSLFPDFLLPALRADRENNTLLFSTSDEVAAKIRADLAVLDAPRAQVRVEAQAWEFATTEEANQALQVGVGGDTFSADTSGEVAVQMDNSRLRGFNVTLQALVAQGRARLSARPFVVVTSGERGSLFLGQNRFVTVLQNTFAGNEVRALNLQIGYSLGVTPVVGAVGDNGKSLITLQLNPRFSTVDEIESGTRLPTLGIREFNSTVRVLDGDSILIAGLDADLRSGARGRSLILPPSRRKNNSQTALVLIVTARLVSSGSSS